VITWRCTNCTESGEGDSFRNESGYGHAWRQGHRVTVKWGRVVYTVGPMPKWIPHRTCQHTDYQLTCAEYEDLLERAGARCEICRTDVGPLCIDHDHTTDVVRGLLCAACNCRLRWVDNGFREPTPDELRYLALSQGVVLPTPQGAIRATYAEQRTRA
jgi:hypothetical protein